MEINRDYTFQTRFEEFGKVVSIGDGITWISGLPSACIDEVLAIEDGSEALVFQLSHNLIGGILLSSTTQLRSGLRVKRKLERLKIPVGDPLAGRIVDPLGYPLDGGASLKTTNSRFIDAKAPEIIDRSFVNRPLYTGNKIVDSFVPIGKGQRQLIIGDNGLGKSSLAIDIIINQGLQNVFCVYVIIGQKRSSVLSIINTLEKFNALSYTCILVAEASSLPGMRFLAPFSGCAIAEYWLYSGKDALIVFDDLTMHAHSYRELSLLLRRSPGREAYPADIFFLHSRLLERASSLSPQLGGGSLTALPIIETKEGEITSYIPTNLISITDGQIYFAEHLFDSGVFPAIDITRSVSRIGGNAQERHIKLEATKLRFEYLQFLELERFTRFGTKLDPKTEATIKRGRLLRHLLTQDRFKVYPPLFQFMWMIAYNDHMTDQLSENQIFAFLNTCEDYSNKTTEQLNENRIDVKEKVQVLIDKVIAS